MYENSVDQKKFIIKLLFISFIRLAVPLHLRLTIHNAIWACCGRQHEHTQNRRQPLHTIRSGNIMCSEQTGGKCCASDTDHKGSNRTRGCVSLVPASAIVRIESLWQCPYCVSVTVSLQFILLACTLHSLPDYLWNAIQSAPIKSIRNTENIQKLIPELTAVRRDDVC